MPSITIEDNILAPDNKILMRYKGKDPFAVVRLINPLLKSLLKVSSSKIFEDDVRWDVTEDPRPFFGMWKAVGGDDVHDKWTTTMFFINYQGKQPSNKDEEGEIRLELKGKIITTIDYSNFLQRAAWWFYFNIFYNQQRRNYIDRSRNYLLRMKEAFQTELGILPEGYE